MNTEYSDTMLTVDTASILDHVLGTESESPIEQYGGNFNNLELTPSTEVMSDSIKTEINISQFKSAVDEAITKYQAGGKKENTKNNVQFSEISDFTELSDLSDY